MLGLLKRPSAWIPIALSAAILAMIGMYMFGIIPPVPPGDEGVAAHLFQIWLMLEVSLITFFAIKWVSKNPKGASLVLLLQLCGVFAGCFPVWYLHL